MAIEELSSIYIAIGAGGVSFIALVWLLIHFVKSLNPTLTKINENNLLHAEIVKNNTIAIGEISKSNQNVASAIKLLETTMAATMAMSVAEELLEQQPRKDSGLHKGLEKR